jgi:hypothetical protein
VEDEGDDADSYYQLEQDGNNQTPVWIPDTWNIDFEMRMELASETAHHKEVVADRREFENKQDRKRTHARMKPELIYRRYFRDKRTIELAA